MKRHYRITRAVTTCGEAGASPSKPTDRGIAFARNSLYWPDDPGGPILATRPRMTRDALVRLLSIVAPLALVVLLAAPPAVYSQYLSENFHGDFGVNSGTQPPPGLYVAIPFAQWAVRGVKDADGKPFAPDQFQGFNLRALPTTLVFVSPKKLLGATYGAMLALPFSTLRPVRVTDDPQSSSWNYADTYVVPVYLGWRTKRADFVAGYGFFAPTGKFDPDASGNAGLGMWSNEIQGGTTVYLDAAKKFSVATTAYLEFHTTKKSEDVKVGTLLTLEGGAAYNVPKIGGAFGIAYYLQNKLTDDNGSDIPELALRALNLRARNRLFGIGPDLTMGLFQRGTTVGAVNVRYLWSSAAKSSFDGGTLWIAFTVGKLRK
jgi:hypothetical protein